MCVESAGGKCGRGAFEVSSVSRALELDIDATNLVAILNSLDNAGLIERHRDHTDRRRAIIELAPRGERLLADLDRALREIDDEVFAPLTPTERDTLNALLAQAVDHIASDCRQPPDGAC